jgi:hypothetical protein
MKTDKKEVFSQDINGKRAVIFYVDGYYTVEINGGSYCTYYTIRAAKDAVKSFFRSKK